MRVFCIEHNIIANYQYVGETSSFKLIANLWYIAVT
jgi:hypothetical protein